MFTLGRKIDFSYKTNKIIVLLSLLIAIIGWMVTGTAREGLYLGGGLFLTWALAREIDPKHDYSAFLAAGFSLLNVVKYENIQLLEIFWIILLMRIVNRITGKELTFFDLFSGLGLTIFLSLSDKNSIYLIGFILAMAYILKTREKKKVVLILSGISLGLFIVESFFMKYGTVNRLNELNPSSIAVIILLGLSFILFWFLSKDEAQDDTGNKVKRSNLLASQILYSATVLLLLFFDSVSINNLIIYVSVILGIAIYFIGHKILNRYKPNAN